MTMISRTIWLVPFFAHIAYVAATYPDLSVHFDARGASSPVLLLIEWFALLGAMNLAFGVLHIRLPKLSDKMLSVPGRDYWLATLSRKKDLVDRLRGVCEAALMLLNVFFLGVYQYIYQHGADRPVLELPDAYLTAGFIASPILLLAAWTFIATRQIAKKAHSPHSVRDP